jgi:hypothetical protein
VWLGVVGYSSLMARSLVHNIAQGIVFGVADMSNPSNILSIQAFLSQRIG